MNAEMEEFKTEILETIDRAEQALLEFDQLPDNQSSHSLYDEVFRAYHNIKGAAGMMEWEELQHHVHQLENVLMQSKQTASIPKHLISWFLKGNDVTRLIMDGKPHQFDYNTDTEKAAIHGSKEESKVIEKKDQLPEEFVSEMNERFDRVSETLLKIETEKGDKDLLDSLYRDIHTIKGDVQLFNLEGASLLSHSMENTLESSRGLEHFEMESSHISTLLMCVDLLKSCVLNPNDEDMLKEVHFMISLLAPFTQVTQKEKQELKIVPKEFGAGSIERSSSLTQPVANHSAESEKTDTSIRVQVSLLDKLMTLMGEMVLVRNQVLQYSNKTDDLEFLNLSQKLDVVTSELQEETMKTRMQPIGNILNKFQRVVRDLSGSLNKKINLNLYGIETELDKTLIEAVKDPLTHIVRNACDHGIETPEARLRSNKSETGTITIKAYHEGGQVIVDISDDGKGLNREKLTKKAIEKGIIDQAKAEKMSDREVHNLIFAPGFSTAEKVTNVSGRGVGMDVVKSNIEKIGGMVDISSSEGNGTKITLKIPLTLAIVPAMIIRSDNHRFAIPQVKLVELVRIERTAIEYVQGRPVYRLRGNILPLLCLKEVLGTGKLSELDEAINIVVLNSDTHLFGMVVDEILDTADIVVKPLARFLKSISIYSGATVLGDGSVAFIMDIVGIAQKHLGLASQEFLKSVSDKYANDFDSGMEEREFVLVGLGTAAKHAIPLSVVNRMEEVKTSSIEMSGHQRVIRYRGGILKLINLNEVLGYEVRTEKEDITQVVVINSDGQTFGLEVDQIIDVLMTRDFLDDSVSTHDAIVGNLVTSNEIIVVIDVDKINEMTQTKKILRSLPDLNTVTSKILFVEDTEAIRTKVAKGLIENGYQVEVAIDGVDGLRKIAEHKCNFDLIISDIEMPKMNGYDFVKKIRSIGQLKEIPIIAFTTKNTPADLQQAKEAGFTTFLEKNKSRLLNLLISECISTKKRKVV
jgi:two-component system chemotaxis sensor kinase CheA